MRHKFSKWLTAVAVIVAAFIVGTGAVNSTHASGRAIGADLSVYQGAYGVYASGDSFGISQVGGTYGGTYVDQDTYPTQISAGTAAGHKMHTYVWDQVGGSIALQEQAMDHFLAKVQTPKGSIVALDYEAGASADKEANTEAILAGMARIKQAGYTPLLYSYKPYILAHVDYAKILSIYPNSGWIAAYKDYSVMAKPDYNYFPSMDGVAMWQFTSTHVAGGLDGDVDLLGVTNNGYKASTTASDGKTTVHPATTTPAINAGQKANNTPKRDLKAGDVVKVNLGATKWATGQGIPSWVRGKTYTVSAISGTRVLLSGIMSWANRADVEILATTQTTASTPTSYRDGKWTIHAEDGTFTANRGLSVWYWPGYSATGSRYYSGESVHYYGWVRNGQYVYVAYHASDGLTHYLAVRDNGAALGTFR